MSVIETERHDLEGFDAASHHTRRGKRPGIQQRSEPRLGLFQRPIYHLFYVKRPLSPPSLLPNLVLVERSAALCGRRVLVRSSQPRQPTPPLFSLPVPPKTPHRLLGAPLLSRWLRDHPSSRPPAYACHQPLQAHAQPHPLLFQSLESPNVVTPVDPHLLLQRLQLLGIRRIAPPRKGIPRIPGPFPSRLDKLEARLIQQPFSPHHLPLCVLQGSLPLLRPRPAQITLKMPRNRSVRLGRHIQKVLEFVDDLEREDMVDEVLLFRRALSKEVTVPILRQHRRRQKGIHRPYMFMDPGSDRIHALKFNDALPS